MKTFLYILKDPFFTEPYVTPRISHSFSGFELNVGGLVKMVHFTCMLDLTFRGQFVGICVGNVRKHKPNRYLIKAEAILRNL